MIGTSTMSSIVQHDRMFDVLVVLQVTTYFPSASCDQCDDVMPLVQIKPGPRAAPSVSGLGFQGFDPVL